MLDLVLAQTCAAFVWYMILRAGGGKSDGLNPEISFSHCYATRPSERTPRPVRPEARHNMLPKIP
jgi:hypothetical protein